MAYLARTLNTLSLTEATDGPEAKLARRAENLRLFTLVETYRNSKLRPATRARKILEARKLVFELNHSLVPYFSAHWLERFPKASDEITSAAYGGLLDAIDRFEIDRGCEFVTYARHYIVGYVKTALKRETNAADRFRSNCFEGEADSWGSRLDFIQAFVTVDARKQPIDFVEREAFSYLIAGLDQRSTEILTSLFVDGKSASEIGVSFGLSRKRINQIKLAAFEVIKSRLAKGDIADARIEQISRAFSGRAPGRSKPRGRDDGARSGRMVRKGKASK